MEINISYPSEKITKHIIHSISCKRLLDFNILIPRLHRSGKRLEG
jgi:hypothetical protein